MDYPLSLTDVYLHLGKFTDGTADGSIPPSRDPARWNNDVTDELLAVIVAGGGVPDEANLHQVRDAIAAMIAEAVAAAAFSIPALPDHAGAAADGDELAIAVGGAHKRISVAELFTNRAGVDQIARDMAMVNAFQLSISGSIAAGTFADWARVNTFPSDNLPTKSGAVWDAVTKTYGNQSGYSADIVVGATVTASSNYGASYTPDKALDGNGATWWQAAELSPWFRIQLTGPKNIRRVSIQTHPAAGNSGPKTFTLKAWDGAAYQAVYTFPVQTGWANGETRVLDVPAHAYTVSDYRIDITDNEVGNTSPSIAEFKAYELTAPSNMVLVDSPFTVPAAPLDGRLSLLHRFTGAGVLNTDIKAFMARDGSGAGGWVEGVLSLQDAYVYGTTYNNLVADFDLSTLPAGTQPLVKITTHNTVEQQIRALGAIAS
ncbi:tail fiber protein [Paramagnetospirillum caucaseum]|uniref:Tail fiber protein n=1 Tax=Paramagnetospirillum caucaseum TaxID=1244869 RepID=M2Y9L0_9PROT|nr:discoidin domain-containing protein [Paramagnetospirillum caucaseum]EME69706.1 tail fiber protein [Paramagnetospirillum caucaseum]